MLYFSKKTSEAEFREVCGNIVARKPTILLCPSHNIVTKPPITARYSSRRAQRGAGSLQVAMYIPHSSLRYLPNLLIVE